MYDVVYTGHGRSNGTLLMGLNPVFLATGFPCRTSATRQDHLKALNESGKPLAFPCIGADRAVRLTEFRIFKVHVSPFLLRRISINATPIDAPSQPNRIRNTPDRIAWNSGLNMGRLNVKTLGSSNPSTVSKYAPGSSM